MRRDEGVPPYRRLRQPSNQTYAAVIPNASNVVAVTDLIKPNEHVVISSVGAAEVEKSPATETERNIHAPAHLPVTARHREIPRERNENKRTRTPQHSPAGGSLPHGYRAEWWLIIVKPSPSGARRGGAKHRKNSPQATVFSQSGEVAMLRAGRWHEVPDEGLFK